MGILKFLLANFQLVMLVSTFVIVFLMLLWSGIPIILLLIYRKLKSIEKILNKIKDAGKR